MWLWKSFGADESDTDRSFLKSLDKITDPHLKRRILKIILKIEASASLEEIPGVKKMPGFKTFYRIRLGDYRLGIDLEEGGVVRFIIIAHRSEIYRRFP